VVNAAVGHLHCYGCDAVYGNPIAMMSHFSKCVPTKDVVASRVEAMCRVKEENLAKKAQEEVQNRKRRNEEDEEVHEKVEGELEPVSKKLKTEETSPDHDGKV
jgi:hypothetical protein